MRTKALVVLSALSIAACSSKDRGSSTGDTGDTGGTVIVATPGDASDIFPPLVNDANGRMVQDLVFDRLAEIGDDMNTIGDKTFRPRLAKSWTWAPDSMSIAFSLDPRARWHDGKPVTASDVRYSFKVFTDPKLASPAAEVLANLDSVSVKDSLTPVIWFKKRTPEQFYDAVYNLIPMPEHVYGSIAPEQMRTSEAARTLVGSGRFRFVKWEPKVRIEVVADTSNYRGRPKLDRVIMAPLADPSAGPTQLLTGAADYMDNFPIDQLPTLDSSKVARPVPFANYGYVFLGMNPHVRKNLKAPHPIFSDVRVRRAIVMGVDRQAMLKNVFGNLGRLSHGPFPMTLAAADSTIKLPSYDTTAAKALLDSAGWKPGPDGIRVKDGRKLRFGLMYPATSPQRRRYSVMLQDQLKKLGVQADLESPDNVTFLARSSAGDYDTELAGYNMDPSVSGLKQNWGTNAIGAGGLNGLFYSNPKVDALLDSATTLFDPVKAKAAASRAYQTIVDDAPAVFLYDIVLIDAVNRRITTAPTRPDGWFQNLADWSIPSDKRIDRDRIGLAPAKP
jgi:peptide/nickel transport system substrate-binding protein